MKNGLMKKESPEFDGMHILSTTRSGRPSGEGREGGGSGFRDGSYLSDAVLLQSFSSVSLSSVPLEFSRNQFLKRGTDILLSLVVITCILSWLVPVVGVLIRITSRGPVFFLQKRNKKNGKVFTCIKFRSMVVNKEADLVQAEEHDVRITRIGKYLRHYHLDEIPQFFNVLTGDMSVVGPRPHMISDNLRYDELIEHYADRLNVRPGITGLAQVMGCAGPLVNLEAVQKRVFMDTFYIRHWSFRLDLVILGRTLLKEMG
jgi:putative colanic acid biosynthesis UDP-glucose lipid carrier transferase